MAELCVKKIRMLNKTRMMIMGARIYVFRSFIKTNSSLRMDNFDMGDT